MSADAVGLVATPQVTYKLYLETPAPPLFLSMMPATETLSCRLTSIYNKPVATAAVKTAYFSSIAKEKKDMLDAIRSFQIPELKAVMCDAEKLTPGKYTLIAKGSVIYRKKETFYVAFAELPGTRFILSGNNANSFDKFNLNSAVVVGATWAGGICAMIEDPSIGKPRTVYVSALRETCKAKTDVPEGVKMMIRRWSMRPFRKGSTVGVASLVNSEEQKNVVAETNIYLPASVTDYLSKNINTSAPSKLTVFLTRHGDKFVTSTAAAIDEDDDGDEGDEGDEWD